MSCWKKADVQVPARRLLGRSALLAARPPGAAVAATVASPPPDASDALRASLERFMRDVMVACADGGLTVVIASHVISELERLCDWLLVLTGGRLQLAGAVEDLVSVHHLLTMPLPTPDAELPGTVISRVDSDRHSTVLVAAGPADLAASLRPGWQSEPVSFEQLVLASLRCPAATASAEPRAGISGIPAQDRRTVAQ